LSEKHDGKEESETDDNNGEEVGDKDERDEYYLLL
jgi:hypothetical protein